MSANATTPDTRPVFFLHIPKTGGNTIVSHVLSFMAVDDVHPAPPQLTLPGSSLAEARARLGSVRFLHGHVDRSLSRGLPLEDLRLVTFIRHPVRRVVSHYLYFRQNPRQALHRAAMAMDIGDFLRRYPGFGNSPQARYIARALGLAEADGNGEIDDLLGKGIEALSRMDFVGVTERMGEAVEAMSDHYGYPYFPVGHRNESTASREEVARCDAILRRDEFLQGFGADFALRREAERRLDAWLARRTVNRIRDGLLAGLRGERAMPWVISRQGGAALTFLDGWFPQGWIGAPAAGAEYWWTGDQANLLVASTDGRPVRLAFDVVHTVGFDRAKVTVSVDDRKLPTTVEKLPDAVRITCEIDAGALLRGGSSAVVNLKGAASKAFADIDPDSSDFACRSFAARRLTLLPVEG